jgi:hypothetical protein
MIEALIDGERRGSVLAGLPATTSTQPNAGSPGRPE